MHYDSNNDNFASQCAGCRGGRLVQGGTGPVRERGTVGRARRVTPRSQPGPRAAEGPRTDAPEVRREVPEMVRDATEHPTKQPKARGLRPLPHRRSRSHIDFRSPHAHQNESHPVQRGAPADRSAWQHRPPAAAPEACRDLFERILADPTTRMRRSDSQGRRPAACRGELI